MEKSNPRHKHNPGLCWTRGSFDDEPADPPVSRREPATSVLKVAQAILAALDPFPEAYQAVLQALRTTLPHPGFPPPHPAAA